MKTVMETKSQPKHCKVQLGFFNQPKQKRRDRAALKKTITESHI